MPLPNFSVVSRCDTKHHKTMLDLAFACPYLTTPCHGITTPRFTSPLQNPAPQHHTLPSLNETSPRFAFAPRSSLLYALARPYPTQLDRNIHCHRLAVLRHCCAKPCPCLTFTTVPSHCHTRPSIAIAELRTTGQHIASPWPRIATHSLCRTQLHSTPPRLGSPLLFYTSP